LKTGEVTWLSARWQLEKVKKGEGGLYKPLTPRKAIRKSRQFFGRKKKRSRSLQEKTTPLKSLLEKKEKKEENGFVEPHNDLNQEKAKNKVLFDKDERTTMTYGLQQKEGKKGALLLARKRNARGIHWARSNRRETKS